LNTFADMPFPRIPTDYRVFWNQSIPGNDLPCGQFNGGKDPARQEPSTFCGLYGIVPAADACDANPA
jgi:hypothetical protein